MWVLFEQLLGVCVSVYLATQRAGAAPFTPSIPILAPRYIPRPTLFNICLPFGAVLDTRSRDRIIERVSSLYAALQRVKYRQRL